MNAVSRLLASLSLCVLGTAAAATLASRNVTAAGANPSANLDQCANGPSDAPVGCTGAAWQNGNANQSSAHWLEGDSIAYRMRFGGLVPGSTHQVTIQWDTTKAGKHALDYLTSYNRTANGDPCSGVSGCGSPLTFPIPPDLNTGLNLPPAPGKPSDGRWNQFFTMFNGTITSVDIADPFIPSALVPYNLTGTYAGDSSTSITITFTAASATPVLAWGAHIANRKDWGADRSAVAITGSPFHMRLVGIDGSGGSQDRGLSSSAVIYPALLTIAKNVVGSNGSQLIGLTPFNFATTSPLVNNIPEVDPAFTLVNDGVTPPDGSLPANQKQFKLFTFGTAGQVTVREIVTTAFQLTGLTCAATLDGAPQSNTNIVSLATATATIVAAEGQEIDCTYVNQQYATLTIIKNVVKTNGGTAEAGSFTLRVSGNGTNLAGPGSASGTSYSLPPGTYTVSEDVPPLSGYKRTGFSGDCDASGTVVMSLGGSKTCTVTNSDLPGHVIVKKLVVNSNGGTKRATDFSFTVNSGAATPFAQDGIDVLKGLNTVDVPAGSYTVLENATPIAGYTTTYSNCSGTILNDETRTCTITNQNQTAHLIITKVVTNGDGGSLTAANFSGTVSGVTASGGQVWTGASTNLTLKTVGSYSVAENAHPGYDATFSADCTGTIALGETKTCTVTNDDHAAHLIISKVVVNNNGGSLTAAGFSGTVSGVTAAAGQTWTGASTNLTLKTVGSYSVAENAHPGYDATFSADCTGTIALGETKTCTITNDDDKAHPPVATTMSWVLHDSLTVTGLRPGGSGGTVTFKLYGPDDSACTGIVMNGSGEVRPVVNGLASTAAGYSLAQAQLPNLRGTFRWIAEYSGDTYNNGAATTCGDETHTVKVLDSAAPAVAQFTAPLNGATSVDISRPIQWTAVAGAQAYELYIGTARGATDLVNSGELQGTSYQATGLPAGALVYARLWTKQASVWRYTDISFTIAR